MSMRDVFLANRMTQHSAVTYPAMGGFHGNGRKANLQERSYE